MVESIKLNEQMISVHKEAKLICSQSVKEVLSFSLTAMLEGIILD